MKWSMMLAGVCACSLVPLGCERMNMNGPDAGMMGGGNAGQVSQPATGNSGTGNNGSGGTAMGNSGTGGTGMGGMGGNGMGTGGNGAR